MSEPLDQRGERNVRSMQLSSLTSFGTGMSRI
jgi:hypothetical protein